MNTTRKGKIGESEIINESLRRGYIPSIPFREGVPYDLILDDTSGNVDKVQIKYVESNGDVITGSQNRMKEKLIMCFVMMPQQTK